MAGGIQFALDDGTNVCLPPLGSGKFTTFLALDGTWKKIDEFGNVTNAYGFDLRITLVEDITTENTSGTDYALVDKLTYQPITIEDVELRLNGVVQTRGAGKCFDVNIVTGVITWLGSSGTGVTLDTTDIIEVEYIHANLLT